MKLRPYMSVVLASVMLACTGVEPILPPDNACMQEYPVRLTVSQEEMTKIALSGNALSWKAEDQIQLTAVTDGIEVSDTIATSVLKVFDIDADDGSKASFTGFVTLRSEPKSCYFTHPVGENMTVDAVNGTVKANYSSQDGSHTPFLYGKVEYNPDGMDVALKHLGTVLEITVETPGVTHISLVGNEIESLSPIIINPEDETMEEPTEAVHQITVPVQAEGKTYLFVPPINLKKGFSLVCTDGTQNNFFVKSYSDGETGGYDFSTKRGARIPITISGEFKQFAVTSSDFNIVHSRNEAGLLTGTTVSFKMSKTGSPDKIIDEWGANLADAEGNIVRTYSSKDAITGSAVIMEVSAGDIFLKAGTYTFTPYFYMYGKPVSLGNQAVEMSINDPGIVLNINGSTSYDKYKAGNVTGANSHANTLLSGLSVSTNVAAEVISEFTYSLVGDDKTAIDVSNLSIGVANSSTIATFGDKTCPKFQGYTMSASITVGNIKKEATRVFHITGLPYEVNFINGDNSSWSKLGVAEYSDKRITFKGLGSWGGDKNAAIVSPPFHIPESYYVTTSLDACYKGDRYINIKPSVSNPQTIEYGAVSVKTNVPNKTLGVYHDLSSKGYGAASSILTLTDSEPSLMYASAPAEGYNLAIYKIKIQYVENN
ncbi:MAG: hypothetical protein IJ394_00235 [Bacteroidales bacterium]|nr:hypothetical protein [Bacteroidales bacterium]